MGLAQKICHAASLCGYVQKDGSNTFHRYRYASAANVLGHVNAALTQAGLAVLDTLPEIVSDVGTGKERVVTVRMTVVVGDDSGERATFRGLGSGMDAGDKAVMKAVTAATKYAWMGAFSISTGDDPEADEDTDRRTSKTRPAPEPTRAEGPSVAREDERPAAQPTTPSQLDVYYQRLGEIELPGEGVAVWRRHRAEIATADARDREHAWRALCSRVEAVGKMKNAKVWLKKAIAEEDARSMIGSGADGGAA